MEEAEKRLLEIGCPKLNIMVRTTNSYVINFYKAIRYKVDGVTTMSKRLISDE